MRRFRRIAIALLATVGMSSAGAAQPGGPPAFVPGLQAQAPPPGPPALGTLAQSPAAPSVTGRVQQFLLTPHGEVDGVLLAEGTVVKFPPHLGVSLASTIRPGDAVSAVGFVGPATSYGRAMKALAITNTRTGQSVVDQPPPSRPLPPHMRGLALVPLTAAGPVAHILVTPKGDVDGLILAAGEQVKFKPRSGALVMALLGQVGGTVAASGYGTRNAFGTVLEAESMTCGNQTISLRGRGR